MRKDISRLWRLREAREGLWDIFSPWGSQREAHEQAARRWREAPEARLFIERAIPGGNETELFRLRADASDKRP